MYLCNNCFNDSTITVNVRKQGNSGYRIIYTILYIEFLYRIFFINNIIDPEGSNETVQDSKICYSNYMYKCYQMLRLQIQKLLDPPSNGTVLAGHLTNFILVRPSGALIWQSPLPGTIMTHRTCVVLWRTRTLARGAVIPWLTRPRNSEARAVVPWRTSLAVGHSDVTLLV